jgi:hypothetical protein
VELLAVWVPHHLGWLELIFLGLLASLVAIVGIFSLFVIAQQFRNPGRPSRRCGSVRDELRPRLAPERRRPLVQLGDHRPRPARLDEPDR